MLRSKATISAAAVAMVLGLAVSNSMVWGQSQGQSVSESELPLRSWADLIRLAQGIDLAVDLERISPDSERARSIAEVGAEPIDIVNFPRVVEKAGSRTLEEWRCATEAAAALYDAEQAFAREDFSGARVGYRKVVRIDPQCYMAHAHLGDTFFREENFAAAIPHYSRAIEINPDDHRNYAYRGHAFLRVGQGDRAYEDFVEALTLRPHFWLVERIVGHYRDFGVEMNDLRILFPVEVEVEPGGQGRVSIISAQEDPVSFAPVSTIFGAYGLCQAIWQVESRSAATGTPEPPSALSFDARREQECLGVALSSYESVRAPAIGEQPGFGDPTLDLLLEARDQGFLAEAVLYGVAGPRFSHLPVLMGPEARASQRRFVERFVLLRRDPEEA